MNYKNKLNTALRALLVIALLAVILFQQIHNPDSQIPITEVEAGTIADLDMSALEEASNRLFKKNYGLNANDYDSLVYYTGTYIMDVDEILIVKLAEDSQSEELTAVINERLDKLKQSFENYGIDQYALLNHSILDVQGNYLLFVIHPEAALADRGFRDSL